MTPLTLSALLLLANVSATSLANDSLTGTATWYDAPSRTDAAAGPALRDMLGADWRGSWVTVSRGERSVTVRLTDWCACGPRDGRPTLIDLDDRAFRILGPLSRGVIRVRVTAVDIKLPATDTAPRALGPWRFGHR